MNKFKELAEGIKGDLVNFNEQADELIKNREVLRLRGEKVFSQHRDNQKSVSEGLAALEEAISSLEGSNSKNGEDSERTSEASFPKT